MSRCSQVLLELLRALQSEVRTWNSGEDSELVTAELPFSGILMRLATCSTQHSTNTLVQLKFRLCA